jgi:hypothetical protein
MTVCQNCRQPKDFVICLDCAVLPEKRGNEIAKEIWTWLQAELVDRHPPWLPNPGETSNIHGEEQFQGYQRCLKNLKDIILQKVEELKCE